MKKRVFIVACGPRSGSTLLQRLLMTHPDLFMWGEVAHMVNHIMRLPTVFGDSQRYYSKKSFKSLHDFGAPNGFYPQLIPFDRIDSFSTKWLDELFANPDDPDKSWGCKFTALMPPAVVCLHKLFPDAGFIFLRRAWGQMYSSILRAKQWFNADMIPDFAARWQKMVEFFDASEIDGLQLTYSELVKKQEESTRRIEEYLEMEPNSLDKGTFAHKLAGY